MDEATCSAAAGKGHLAVLQWAREQGCPWWTDTCQYAAGAGHLAVLQWARQQGCLWGAGTCSYAAKEGHLDVLQWARQNGCPLHEAEVCKLAAQGGHLVVLQWARQHGCSCDWRTGAYAAGSGHLAVLQWVWANGCPLDMQKIWGHAAIGGHLEVLQWAQQRSPPGLLIEDVTWYAIHAGHFTVSLWLLKHGYPCKKVGHKRLQSTVASMTLSYLVLRTAAPTGIPSELLRDMVMAAHWVD